MLIQASQPFPLLIPVGGQVESSAKRSRRSWNVRRLEGDVKRERVIAVVK